MLKRLIRSSFGNRLMGWMIAALIAALMVTVRWRRADRAGFAACLAAHHAPQDGPADDGTAPRGVIVVFWHERIFAMPYLWPRGDIVFALQSPHADGRMMSHAIHPFGIQTIWGSTNRLAHSALRGLARVLADGGSVAMTPDGPRGPAKQAAIGPVALARLTGCPIVPVCWSADRVWRAASWDRTIIPKPFARGRLFIGEPIHVTDDQPGNQPGNQPAKSGKADLQAISHQLEEALTRLGDHADATNRQGKA